MNKKIGLLLVFILLSIASFSQTTNIKGFYLKDLNGWLGDTAQENTILRYAQNNGLNYIIMYDLGAFNFTSTTNRSKLAAFNKKAKTQYGIFQIGASGEIYSFYRDAIIPFNRSRHLQSERYDVFNFEFEYWVTTDGVHVSQYYITRYLQPNGYFNNDTADCWNFSWNEFKQVDSSARANNVLSEYYLGWPNKGQMQQIVSRAGRILLHAYRPTDVDIYAYSKNRLRYAGSLNQYANIVTIFSSEPSFMGPWLGLGNPITKPYQTYVHGPNTNYNYFDSDTGNWKQYVNLLGYVWFTYNYNPQASALASITSDGPTTFCIGGSVTLTATLGSQYLWSPGGQTTRSITVNQAGNYSVRVTNFNGQNATSQVVRVSITTSIPSPTIYVNGPTTICNGGGVDLYASAADSVRWSNGATTQSITVTQPGNYTVIAYASGGCSAVSAPVTINVVPVMPTPVITPVGPTNVCQGTPVQLYSSVANGYLWSTGETTRSIVVTQPGIYYVTAYGGPNCYSQSFGMTITNPSATPTPTISANGSTYLSSTHTSVMLTSSYVNSGNYYWSNGTTTRNLTVTAPGNYRVTTTGTNQCPSTSLATIVSNSSCTPPTTPTISFNGSNILTLGHTSVNLTSSVSGGYLWSTGQTSRTISVYSGGTYSVRSYSGGGCYSASLSVNVYQYFNPIQTGNFPIQIVYYEKQNKLYRPSLGDLFSYPNPSSGRFSLSFESHEKTIYKYVLTNPLGQTIQEKNLQAEVGNNVYELEIENSGIYFANIFSGENRSVVKIIIN